MTDSITPPPELVTKWILESDIPSEDMYEGIATRAAQWGADQELKACAKWVGSMFYEHKTWSDELRAARRPIPPSLKEQALFHFESFAATFETSGGDSDLIRRALEALPE